MSDPVRACVPVVRRAPCLQALLASLASLGALACATALAAGPLPAELHIPGVRVIPESLSSAQDGTVYISSVGTGIIRRAAPGSDTALPWIMPVMGPREAVFGVFVDERSGTLWACANTRSRRNDTVIGSPSELQGFDLRTGALRGRFSLPTPGALCNDIAAGPDGSVYATDSNNMQVVRLRPGGSQLEVWSAPGAFGPMQATLDGIAVLDGSVYVNTWATGRIYVVPIAPGGDAGAAVQLRLPRQLDHPDGMRSHGQDGMLLVESGGPGRLSALRIDSGGGSLSPLKEGFPDGSVAVTVVGRTAYVLEAQWQALANDPHYVPNPFHATAVDLPAPPAPPAP